MSQATISRVMNSEGERIGIKNIDKRIKLIFGEEYGVAIHSELKVGTSVTITIPFNNN